MHNQTAIYNLCSVASAEDISAAASYIEENRPAIVAQMKGRNERAALLYGSYLQWKIDQTGASVAAWMVYQHQRYLMSL